MYNQSFQSFVAGPQNISVSSNLSGTEQIQKLLFQAFKYQNSEYYDDALQSRNLQNASEQIIKIIESMQKNPQFYMKVMPIMKQERELVQQTQYKQFWGKNQKVLCRNFQKNAYRALIMQEIKEMQQRQIQKLNQKGVIFDDQNNMYSQNTLKPKKKKGDKTEKSGQKRKKYKSKSVQKPRLKGLKSVQVAIQQGNAYQNLKDCLAKVQQKHFKEIELVNLHDDLQDPFNLLGNHESVDDGSQAGRQIRKSKSKKSKKR